MNARRAAILAVLALAMPISVCMTHDNALLKAEPILSCEITGEESYRSGEPAVFMFRLENRSARAVFVLKWHTPLEGIMSRIFKVTRDGEELEYQGLMARRGDPVAEDYEEIAPGEAASASFDLAKVYDLAPAGDYDLEFVSRILDVTTDRSEVPRPLDRHQPLDVECNDLAFSIQG